MASKALTRKKTASRRVGRSALTGCYILAPVTKQGSITLDQARAAVREVQAEKLARAENN